MHNMKLLF